MKHPRTGLDSWTDKEYQMALACVDMLMGAEPDSDEGKAHEAMVTLVHWYEEQHLPWSLTC